MKLVNPIGRVVSNSSSISTSACLCGTWGGYSDAKTDTKSGKDSCWHCGCDCTDSSYDSGNSSGATTSPWASSK